MEIEKAQTDEEVEKSEEAEKNAKSADASANQSKAAITPSAEVKSSKCLSIVFGIVAAITILAAIFLLIFPFGVEILAAIVPLVGTIAAKILIFTPGAFFAILAMMFLPR
ncbi:MAG: hypothetical protein LBI69_00095 [Puniceicoccales bacterium]|nr:hypothetical protein [Puniceicoccales bacterium]